MTKIIAHRGSQLSGTAENTLAAFATAIDLGADGLEVDVRLADNELYLGHDVPQSETFRAFLDLVRQRDYQGELVIELKGSAGAPELLALVQELHLPNPIVMQSFDIRHVLAWTGTNRVGYLRHLVNVTAWRQRQRLQFLNLDIRFWWLRWLVPKRVTVYWWTVNDAKQLTKLMCAGVAGVITDDVMLAQQIRGRENG